MSDNLKIWNSVCTTDPDSTKQVTFGRGFTAIDAHSQIQKATEVFGPIGEGWAYENEFKYIDDLVMCELILKWGKGLVNSFGPICGCAELNPRGKTDTDAPKKAMTDALTKALSHLGFNADVFLGKFDDNKYVQGLRDEKAFNEQNKDLFEKFNHYLYEATPLEFLGYKMSLNDSQFQAVRESHRADKTITKWQEEVRAKDKEGHEVVNAYIELIGGEDHSAVSEAWEEFTPLEQQTVNKLVKLLEKNIG